ncbi:nitroreductase [Alteromonas sediminis]|uniref:Nitroreductase n=1 Tax=Alteromonas sediminis TaxID=2259342 RepID=A0A3N5Z6Y8_9ALTE|nr:nitroreductase [Alteromonas sediminis]RPJ66414.1 nitroreductase [Alteromonas sediminis]
MTFSTMLDKRYSCRAFLDKPVDSAVLQRVFEKAQRSPSNCNVQPWQVIVVSGEKKTQLAQQLVEEVIKVQKPYPDFNWLPAYEGVHRERQFGSANALYSAMGIERQDKVKRQQAMLRNWQFFDAPHVAFFTMDKYLDIMGAVDIGIYAQTLSMLMYEEGISSCMQGALGQFPNPIKSLCELPEERGILFGMSFGYADSKADANQARTVREPVSNSVLFID